jgi:hypothetical protein
MMAPDPERGGPVSWLPRMVIGRSTSGPCFEDTGTDFEGWHLTVEWRQFQFGLQIGRRA